MDYTINGLTHTKIKDYAYIGNEQLVELIIPDGVTHIGERAFSKCKNLRRVVLPESLVYIGTSAFSECERLEEIVIPNNIKKLNYRTFADCKRLKRVVMADSVQELDWAVFSGCENLEKVIWSDNITKIGKQLFLNCKKLKNITLPQNLEMLPDECFKGCHNLEITINQKITQLGNRTFEDCYKLSTFPENIITFGENCFRNCRNLTKVILNNKIKELSNGLFDGCIKLSEVIYRNDNLLRIGKRCFRNCESLKSIPSFVANFNERAFENCTGLTSINIIDNNVPFACFRGCKNINKILNPNDIYTIGSFAFSGCESLEEFDVIHSKVISAEAFSNCQKLKRVRLNMGLRRIDSRAFFNCHSLFDIKLPNTIEIVKKEAFKNCHSIKQITIPANLNSFGDGAFSYMDSCETIDVSPYNKTFMTPDNKILINQMKQELVLYASGCKDKSYSLEDYNVEIDPFGVKLIKPITCIGRYAFAGTKNLEELTICGCSSNIEYNAFQDCPNLKKLNIMGISLYTCLNFTLTNHGITYFIYDPKKTPFIPFESIEYKGKIVKIDGLSGFTNVTNITFPEEGLYTIGSDAFIDCEKLKKVFIPKNVKAIKKNAFPSSTTLEFNNDLKINGLIEMQQVNEYSKYKEALDEVKKHNDDTVRTDENYAKINPEELIKSFMYSNHLSLLDYTLYNLDNNTFYIEQDNKITSISKQYIDKICKYPEEIRDNPALFLDFMNDLINHDLAVRPLFNGILMSRMNLLSRKILFDNFTKDDDFALEVLEASGILDKTDIFTDFLLNNFDHVISKINILKKYKVKDPVVCHKLFMCSLSDKMFEKLIKTDYELLKKVIKDSKIIEFADKCRTDVKKSWSDQIFNSKNLGKNLLAYINLIKRNNGKAKYLLHPIFLINDSPLCTKLIEHFDENTKRLLKASKIFDGTVESVVVQNFSDLLNLLEMTGCLEDDPITRQRACTFITEKMFDEILPNGKINEYRIVGNDIHSIFNFGGLQTKYNEEFATFFLENYKKLYRYERQGSGLTERVYRNFKEISKTYTSNKGSQRKLKVTFNKCINYLLTNKFNNVSKEYADLATLIGQWYDENKTWETALMIYKESLNAPRNIFTKWTFDEKENMIFDDNPDNDLREELSENFSYEWLPKQSYDNLVLGKYCNCCAHVEGAGQGIMRSSMILNNCQNLVIRDRLGDIIAKSTIYVNREQGYAVFNNVEASLRHRTPEDLKKIYKAFMRGSNDFIDVYNNNNIEIPINTVTIGTSRNKILDYLDNSKHPSVPIMKSLNYGNYSVKSWSGYNGDWDSGQRLVLKR